MWNLIGDVFQYAVGALIAYMVYITKVINTKTSKSTLDKVEAKLSERLDKYEDRSYDLEKRLFEQMATRGDIKRVEGRVEALAELINKIFICQPK